MKKVLFLISLVVFGFAADDVGYGRLKLEKYRVR